MDALEERTLLLTGQEGMERLRSARVILFGVGGVGSFAAEALARAGPVSDGSGWWTMTG